LLTTLHPLHIIHQTNLCGVFPFISNVTALLGILNFAVVLLKLHFITYFHCFALLEHMMITVFNSTWQSAMLVGCW